MIINELVSQLYRKYGADKDVEQEELKMFLSTIFECKNYEFKVGDIVRIYKKYPDYERDYIGEIGSFDYGQTEDGKGPTEAIRLRIALYYSTTGYNDVVYNTAPSGETSIATLEELTDFKNGIKNYDYLKKME